MPLRARDGGWTSFFFPFFNRSTILFFKLRRAASVGRGPPRGVFVYRISVCCVQTRVSFDIACSNKIWITFVGSLHANEVSFGVLAIHIPSLIYTETMFPLDVN